MLKLLDEIRIRPQSYLKFGLYTFAIAIVYFGALSQLVLHDWAKEDYSHCLLIPFVVLYLIWEKRKTLSSLPSIPSWVGMVPLVLGIALFWLGELGGEYFAMYMSLYLVIVGLSLLHLGWQKLKAIGFAFVMMLAMFPFPNFINVRLSLYLKLISSQIGVWMLHLYGMSAYREGNVIDLGFTQLQVVDACSGLRYLISLMVLALILAYWFKGSFWKRAFLFLSSIPIAIFVNSFRIALTGVLYSFWGPVVAEGFFHGFSGWLIFIFTFGILLLEMWVLKRVGKKDVPAATGDIVSEYGQPGGSVVSVNMARQLLQPQFLLVMVLLMLTFGFSQGIEFREKIPIAKPLSGFPVQVGSWSGVTVPMEQQFKDALDFSDYTIINYKNKNGSIVNFYVAYYESQRKGESIHSPETCLPGSGWAFKEAGIVNIPLAGGSSMQVNRSFMENGDVQQLVYYWFPQRGRVLTNLYQLKLYAFWDALSKQRTDGALVRIITALYPGESRQEAEARLQGFTKEVAPLLDQFLPGRDLRK